MKKADLAYIAGLFDGEGSISIHRTKHTPKRFIAPFVYTLTVQLGLANPLIPKSLRFAFGGHVSFQEARGNRRRFWKWQIASNKAVDFLTAILPYLRLKRDEAEVAIYYQKHRRKAGGNKEQKGVRQKTEAELAFDEAQRILLKSLKDKSQD